MFGKLFGRKVRVDDRPTSQSDSQRRFKYVSPFDPDLPEVNDDPRPISNLYHISEPDFEKVRQEQEQHRRELAARYAPELRKKYGIG